MAFEKPVVIQSFTAASALTNATNRYSLVKLLTGETVVPCTSTTDIAVGILQNLPAQGEQAEVMMLGVSKLRIGAVDVTSVTMGLYTCDATGRAMLAAPTTGSGSFIFGRIIQIDATDNDASLVTATVNTLLPGRQV